MKNEEIFEMFSSSLSENFEDSECMEIKEVVLSSLSTVKKCKRLDQMFPERELSCAQLRILRNLHFTIIAMDTPRIVQDYVDAYRKKHYVSPPYDKLSYYFCDLFKYPPLKVLYRYISPLTCSAAPS